MTFLQNLDKAASVAICTWLSNGGNGALGGAVVAGLAVPGGQVPALAAGLGVMALNYGCTFDPTTPIPPTTDTGFCHEAAGGTVDFDMWRPGQGIIWWTRMHKRIDSITAEQRPGYSGGPRWFVKGIDIQGKPFDYGGPPIQAGDYYKVTPRGAACSDFEPPSTPAPLPPVTYTGGDAECNINVEFVSWVVEEDGNVRPVMKMSPATQTLASGGVIGGCNFNPVIYSGPPGGGGEPPWFAPWAPGPDGPGGEPWWYPLMRGAAAGAVGAVVGELLDKLFPKKLPGVLYRLTSVCELNANGDPISQAVERSIPEMETFAGLDARLGALVDIAQGLKDFRQPICPTERFRPVGEMVSVNFQSSSDEVPAKDRVRKEFRYRDQNSHPESFHIDHWRSFSWLTGPVIVKSTGLSWGQPQVWAATADEGKRVIAHAAAAAGVDLTDPRHQWEVSTTASPRYGRQARVYPVVWDDSEELMISKRDGPSGLPGWKRDP
jgi:hypothetical protein